MQFAQIVSRKALTVAQTVMTIWEMHPSSWEEEQTVGLINIICNFYLNWSSPIQAFSSEHESGNSLTYVMYSFLNDLNIPVDNFIYAL